MIFATHSMSEHHLGSPEHRNVESVIDKTSSQGFQNTIKNQSPKCIKSDFHKKSIFAIPSMPEPRLGSPEDRNFESVIDKTNSQGF